jgi:hypothetical protein
VQKYLNVTYTIQRGILQARDISCWYNGRYIYIAYLYQIVNAIFIVSLNFRTPVFFIIICILIFGHVFILISFKCPKTMSNYGNSKLLSTTKQDN